MSVFDTALGFVIGAEGGFTDDQNDPGNWTGGAIGSGECRGTSWGIAAAAFPALDIAALTRDQAAKIYRDVYWTPLAADNLPPALALLVFDAAVNNGAAHAARWLQQALGVVPDGWIGPVTLAAAAAAKDVTAVAAEFLATRTDFMARLPGWREFGLGWARRLCALPFAAMRLAGGAAAAANDARSG